MCDVLDRIENRGIEKGIQAGIEKGIQAGIEKGIQAGIQKGEAQIMRNMYQKGFSLEQIADVVEKTVDEVKDIVMKENPLLS